MKECIYYLVLLLASTLFIFTGNLIYILLSILITFFIFLKNKEFKKLMLSLFFTYIVGILYYTLFSPFYNRNLAVTGWTISFFKQYIKSCNFIPFKTIISFIKHFFIFSEEITQNVILLNLIGNFICLIPLSIFIPFFFRKFKRKKNFVFLIIFIAFIIELLQLITMNGAFDIDDIILNSSGCILFYLLFYKEINNFFENYKIGNDAKEIKIFFLKLLLTFSFSLIVAILFYIRSVKEKNYWNDYHFDELKLINYSEVCVTKDRSLIYEDDLFNYYINCSSPEDILISINNNKFSLMDYLDGKTKYPILIHMLENAGLVIEKEDKYEKLILCPKKMSTPTYKSSDYSIADIVQTTDVNDDGAICKAFYVIPRSDGETNLVFEFEDEIMEYYVIVKNNELKLCTKSSD